MRIIGCLFSGLLLVAGATMAQAPQESFPPVATMMELMANIIHPASNEILLAINRPPMDDKEWAVVQRSAIILAESGNLLMVRGRARDQAEWPKDVKMMVDVGAAAYKAARAKDVNALAALAAPLDASCFTCHKQYRPNVHPGAK